MPETIIDIKGAHIFQQDNLILSNVNVHINKGEFVYLIGKTGSGKSSFLKLLYGDLELKQGYAVIDDFELHGLKRKQIPYLRRTLGIVFQDFQLLTDRSVEDNLIFVMKATGWKNKDEMKTRIKEVLDSVGLGTKGFKMPHELSGGEQQRVVIARALVNKPSLILADEPTGNLDPETSDEILKLLIDISKEGVAILMATHNYDLMTRYPSRTLKCEGGNIFEVEQNSDRQV